MPSSRSTSRTGPVAARDLPVALAHVADQDRVELVVHRVHLAEVGVADQRLRGAHQRRRDRVALGGVAVAVGHQVGGGEQRQLLEAAVAADRLEVRRERPVAPLVEQSPDRELHPRRVGVGLPRELGVDVEQLGVARDHLVDLRVGDFLHAGVQVAEALVDHRRPDRAQHAPAGRRGCPPCRSSGSRAARSSSTAARSRSAPPAPRTRRSAANSGDCQSSVSTENGTPVRTRAFAWSWAPWIPWL